MDTKDAGRLGGKATKRNQGKDYYKNLQKKSVDKKRLKKLLKLQTTESTPEEVL